MRNQTNSLQSALQPPPKIGGSRELCRPEELRRIGDAILRCHRLQLVFAELVSSLHNFIVSGSRALEGFLQAATEQPLGQEEAACQVSDTNWRSVKWQQGHAYMPGAVRAA
eukprot:TRINITY_DN27300_c0_g1_i2.p1 TRINITY_DN27300_c0_g1~~TRINITY_DN27300_c0_g1_i2.p1  ORF type:complete len:111 (-),score=11.37 TRINITY_DN27300_c0_g1_i2:289-621(-)